MPAVYDKEKQDSLEDSFSKPSIADEDRNAGQTSSSDGSPESDTLEDSFSKPSIADEDRNTNKPKSQEESALASNDDDSAPWKNKVSNKNDKKKGRFGLTKRRSSIGGLAIGIIIGGGVGISTFLSGPLRIIHYATLLKDFHFGSGEEFSARRTSKLIRYAKLLRGGDAGLEDFNLGRAGNKIAVHYEGKLRNQGIGFEYKHGRLTSIEIDPNTAAGKKMIKDLETKYGTGLPLDGNNKVKLEFAPDSNSITDLGSRRITVGDAVEATDMKKVSKALAARLLKKRAGLESMFHPIKRFKGKYDEKFWLKLDEWKAKRLQDIDSKVNNGTTPPDVDVKSTTDPETGESTMPKDVDAGSFDAEVGDAKKPTATPDLQTKAASFRAKLAKPVGAFTALAMACGLDAIGNEVANLQESNIVKPLIRLGMTMVITPAAQIMSGNDVSMIDLSVISDSFYDHDKKTDFLSAESIQHNLGKEDTGVKIPDSAKPGRGRPLFFQVIHDVITAIPGGPTVCKGVTSGFGQVASFGLDVFMGFLSGGVSGAIALGAGLGGEAASRAFGDDLIRVLAGKVVDIFSYKGGQFGTLADTGVFLSENNNAMAMGGRKLTTPQVKALNYENNQRIKKEIERQPFYARLFDVKSPYSLVSKAVIDNPDLYEPETVIASIINSPFKVFNTLGSTLKSFSPSVFAETTPFDYGVDKYGYSIKDRDSSLVEDPYENEKAVKPHLEELNEKYGECFGTTIDPLTGKFTTTEAPSYVWLEDNQGTCGADNDDPMFLRYRTYIADTVLMSTITCYEGVDNQSCNEIGMGSNSTPDNNLTAGDSNVDVGQDTSSMQCPAGSQDAGVAQDYGPGKVPTIKIKLCIVNGIKVNASIAQNTINLLAAAKNDGLTLTGGSFRSYDEQYSLRVNNCPDPINSKSSKCSPPTAKPGNSNHEVGLAIDFSNMCTGISGASTCPSSPGWVWMTQNAARFGFKKLSSEAWHWSPNGS